MNSGRLPMLLVLAVGLLLARWLTWPRSDERSIDVVQVAQRAAPPIGTRLVNAEVSRSEPQDLAAGTRDLDVGEVRNAFAVRLPVAPKAGPPPRPVEAPKVVSVAAAASPAPAPAPIPPSPPAPPPLQVIGAWKDVSGTSLFLAGPQGVLQARAGDTVLSEWRIESITQQAVMLRQASTNREAQLPLPETTRAALLVGVATK